MNPPANASSENRADSRRTTRRDRRSPSSSPDVVGALFPGRRLDRGAETPEPDGQREADDRVADDDGAIGIDRGQAADRAGPG